MPPRIRSTADDRRTVVVKHALQVFARTGYHATPVSDVAAASGISQGYVIRLFGTKLDLFVAVVDHCFARIVTALSDAADQAAGDEPNAVLAAMSAAYVELIADRDLLMVQVHAQSAADTPQIRDAIRRGFAAVLAVAHDRSHAEPSAIQRFIAYGQLCHLIVTAELDDVDEAWARTLTQGMQHV
jgi:AcrR family transcriptional regulator